MSLLGGVDSGPMPGGYSGTELARHARLRSNPAVDQVENVPATSGPPVVARLPLIVVSSITTVPPVRRSAPPPIPVPAGLLAPLEPTVAWPGVPLGVPPDPATAGPVPPRAPPGPAFAAFAVMRFVVQDFASYCNAQDPFRPAKHAPHLVPSSRYPIWTPRLIRAEEHRCTGAPENAERFPSVFTITCFTNRCTHKEWRHGRHDGGPP